MRGSSTIMIATMVAMTLLVSGCGSTGSVKPTNVSASVNAVTSSKSDDSATTTNYTFAVSNSLQMPNTVQNSISSHSKVLVSLPRALKLDSSLSVKRQLAIDLHVSPDSYAMDIFERSKTSSTNKYTMATLVGNMETVSHLKFYSIPHDFATRRFTTHKPIILVKNTSATNYLNAKSYDNAIIWNDKGWHFVAEGIGTTFEPKASRMANTIAGFIAKTGLPVPKASRGYVQAIWAGNRPSFRVTWTYNNEQWYSLSMATLSETLKTARTVVYANRTTHSGYS
ncbi:hypothetical protein [Alicyclobacillus sp. SO9]|uniref:hypothetical protein n=1 Tax=Alicyclobacillus sp. SO9 TaxID=2665646 RepID=UPI0018E78FA0|nr:hypothetical protein [Alicyclobacillus sp. SO9]QQE77110.1 hypothetical protein GI364_14110 [Alicyclobacillus sp. SO9]